MIISASLVNNLRKKTGAGIMDCKRALVETSSDFELAINWLRSRGAVLARTKMDRVTFEGLTALAVNGNKAVIIEINSETDFVARNSIFQNLTKKVVHKALTCYTIEQLQSSIIEDSKTVEDFLLENIAIIGEKITIRRIENFEIEDGIIGSYVHNAVTENVGKISVLVALKAKITDSNKEKLTTFAKKIAMHIAASKPLYLDRESVDSELIEREKSIFIEQSSSLGKPDEIMKKMVDSKINKFLEEIVLLEQFFVMDTKLRISEVLTNISQETGTKVDLAKYVRYEVGEKVLKNTN